MLNVRYQRKQKIGKWNYFTVFYISKREKNKLVKS